MPIQSFPRRIPAILPAMLSLVWAVSGCSDGSAASYPSLASRPAERLTDAAQPTSDVRKTIPSVAAAPGVPSADLAARLAKLVEQARSAQRDFDGKRAGVERQVSAAGAAAVGSDDWGRATQALSGIESARSLTAQPLADLDRLEIDDRLAHPASAGDGQSAPRLDAAAIAQARDTVAGLVADEDAVLAKLDGRLKR